MSVISRTSALIAALSSSSEILTNPNDVAFQEYLKRWSDIDRKTPAAIVLPTSEEGCQKTVKPAPRKRYVELSLKGNTGAMGHQVFYTVRNEEWRSQRMVDYWQKWHHHRSESLLRDRSPYALSYSNDQRQHSVSKEVAVRLAEAGIFTGTQMHVMGEFCSFSID
jgi:hypothetical protein